METEPSWLQLVLMWLPLLILLASWITLAWAYLGLKRSNRRQAETLQAVLQEQRRQRDDLEKLMARLR